MGLEQPLTQNYTSEEPPELQPEPAHHTKKAVLAQSRHQAPWGNFLAQSGRQQEMIVPIQPSTISAVPSQAEWQNSAPQSRELQVLEVSRQPMAPRFSPCELSPAVLFLSFVPLQAFDSCIDAARHNWVEYNPIKQQNKLKNTTAGE